MSFNPIFISSFLSPVVHIGGTGTLGNTKRLTSSGILGTENTDYFLWLTAGDNGSRLDSFSITAAGTNVSNTAGAIRFWIYSNREFYLFKEVIVPVVTPSATTPGFTYTAIDQGIFLEPGKKIYVTSQVLNATGDQFNILATQFGNY